MSSEREERSFGNRETLRSERTGAVSAGSMGDRETLRDGEGWGILEEWGGKRWQAGEEILGRYVVERELGQGGMGVVYGCFDKVGGVRVAVKALPPELSHNSVEMEEVRENFELVVGLRHPNIAGVRTLEKDERGEFFLVMDVAEGANLRKWLREKWKAGGVSLKEAADVLCQVAAALDYAHCEKVVHRDVKPGNVMIDGRGRVKVLDFGLAAQIRTSLSRASHAYRGTSGTGPYMAPEQWEGKQQDGKADQYALGVMAYEMLAGHLPFENSELAVLKDAVLHGSAETIPGLPKGAMAALRRAMAKRKGERFGSCGEFVAALAGGGGRRSARGKAFVWWVVVLGVVAGVWMWGGNREKVLRAEGLSYQATEEMEDDKREAQECLAAERSEEVECLAEKKKAYEEVHPATENTEKTLEEAASEEDDGTRWRAEREAVDAAATSIDILQAHARDLAGKLAEYEKNPTGLSDHIGAAKAAVEELAAIQPPATAEEAKAYLVAGQMASGRLTMELEWLARNKAARDTSLRVEAEIVSELDPPLKEYEATDSAKGKFRDGMKARKTGNDALAAGNFREAQAQLERAKRVLGEALADARTDRAKRQVASAKRYADESMWGKCLDLAEAALVAEPGNEEARRLKEKAEGELKPSILLKAGEMKTITLPGGATMEMVWCPAGSFWMGSPESEEERAHFADETLHRVTLTTGFWLAKTEVTQKQWKSVMGNNPSHFTRLFGADTLPVEMVTWDDAQQFCRKAGHGLRLPTEAEWEYACRAGSLGPIAGTGRLDDMGWYDGNSKGRTQPVGKKKPNAWGLYDMHGNVNEWCEDWIGPYPCGDVTNPRLDVQQNRRDRVLRGGSWEHFARVCRSANRYGNTPDYPANNIGFRPCCFEDNP